MDMDVARKPEATAPLTELKPSDLAVRTEIMMFKRKSELEARHKTDDELRTFLSGYPEALRLRYLNDILSSGSPREKMIMTTLI